MDVQKCTGCGETKPLNEFYRQDATRYKRRCKVCHNQAGAVWRQRNKARVKQKNAERYARDRERILSVSRAWKQRNPDKVRAHVRKRRAAHPEACKAWAEKYVAEHRQLYRDAVRKWQRANMDKVRANLKRRKARRKGAPGGNFTAEQWGQMQAAYGYRCAYCGCRPDKLTQDHVLPLSRGGAHTAENIVPACGSCNSRKSKRTPAEAGMSLAKEL